MSAPTPVDPRDLVDTHHGHRMRDAAVDPLPKDFLAPTNAGEPGELGNPHGPYVVSPGLHGVEANRSIPGGPVSSDAATQEAKELANLAEWQPQVEDGPEDETP